MAKTQSQKNPGFFCMGTTKKPTGFFWGRTRLPKP